MAILSARRDGPSRIYGDGSEPLWTAFAIAKVFRAPRERWIVLEAMALELARADAAALAHQAALRAVVTAMAADSAAVDPRLIGEPRDSRNTFHQRAELPGLADTIHDHYLHAGVRGFVTSLPAPPPLDENVRDLLEPEQPPEAAASWPSAVIRQYLDAPTPTVMWPLSEAAEALLKQAIQAIERGALHQAIMLLTTAPEAMAACAGFAALLAAAIRGTPQGALLNSSLSTGVDSVDAVLAGAWKSKSRDAIRSSGYVIDGLEAALWCVGRTATFRDAVILAANLGDDADTVAAIAGQLAGAIQGAAAIPGSWLDKLARRDRIAAAADALFAIDGAAKASGG
jgi:hypothetical protein